MKAALPLLLGLAGGVLGGLLAGVLRPEPEARASATPVARAPAPGLDEPAVERIVDARLDRRLAEFPRGEGGRAAPGPTATPGAEGEGLGEGTTASEAAGAQVTEQAIRELVDGLKGRKLVPADTNRLFSWLSVRKDRIQDVIKEIEKAIAEDPQNPELQVALATAYVADLTNNTLPGPQQGIVWMKAQGAYDAAIKLEPEHWTARFGKAFGTSMAPEFLGMRPEAIRQFEELLDIQKRQAPQPHFAGTYFRLGTLYKDAGNVEKAREIWGAGLALFPDNEELKGTIEVSTKK
jgi:hypothetical protein